MSDIQLYDQNLTGQITMPPGAYRAPTSTVVQYATPVYVSGPGIVGAAKADAAGTSLVVGLSCREVDVAGGNTYVTPTSGLVDFPTQIWDGVTGQTGGLTPGSAYYLSAATVGKLTTTAPSGGADFIVLIGIARDPTTIILNISFVPSPAPVSIIE